MKPVKLSGDAGAQFYIQRIMLLTPDSQRQWGRFTVPAMLAHVTRAIQISLGELALPDQSTWFMRTIVKWVFIYWLPWPRGKIQAPPSFLADHPGEFETERNQLISTISRFAAAAAADPD